MHRCNIKMTRTLKAVFCIPYKLSSFEIYWTFNTGVEQVPFLFSHSLVPYLYTIMMELKIISSIFYSSVFREV